MDTLELQFVEKTMQHISTSFPGQLSSGGGGRTGGGGGGSRVWEH